MGDDKFNEHPLDSMLDSEPEAEFGEPEIRDRYDHAADENVDGNLKNWTAEDFASIYVRFRPHLERHAKRYLSNPVQAEEVVQDAFLYLMTTLPELDSELGVLKFLKWKIRLLCLDVLRSASNQRETSVPEHAEFASDDDEITADLERAEDNAIIRMALASLNPRQREVLVASVYEEKSTEEIAEQLKLSPNATRQLLFRARSAFKKALVGEAEIQGKSISQVLTIAAKKAALDTRQNATKVGAFIAMVALGIGIIPNLVPSSETVVASNTPEVISNQPAPAQTTPADQSPADQPAGSDEPLVVGEESENESAVEQTSEFATEAAENENVDTQQVVDESPVTQTALASSGTISAQSAFIVESEPFDPWALDHIYEATIGQPSVISYGTAANGRDLYTLASDKGVWTDFSFSPDSPSPLQDFTVGFVANSKNFFASPNLNDFYVVSDGDYQTYVFVGELGRVNDSMGNSWDNTRVDGSSFVLELVINDTTNELANSRISVS